MIRRCLVSSLATLFHTTFLLQVFVSVDIETMVCISLVYCNGVRMCVHPLWTGVHACRCSIDRRSMTRCGMARQTRRFWWLPVASADAAGRTRRLQRHGGVGAAPSQCPYIVLVSITMVHLIVCSTDKKCTSTR
jgi:hypothetical protein